MRALLFLLFLFIGCERYPASGAVWPPSRAERAVSLPSVVQRLGGGPEIGLGFGHALGPPGWWCRAQGFDYARACALRGLVWTNLDAACPLAGRRFDRDGDPCVAVAICVPAGVQAPTAAFASPCAP